MQYPTVSLIIATYNSTKALKLCFMSVLRQTKMPDQIVIADDGSGPETREIVEKFQKECPVPVLHVWHEDEGFRLTVIRNKAIAKCTGDYILQVDGDLILHKDFVKDHVKFAKPNSYVTGSRVKMSAELTKQLQESESINVSVHSKGTQNYLNGCHFPLASKLFKHYKTNKIYYVRGCNMAFWRKDLIAVNGYNEDIVGWGREDSDIACRLNNLGLERRFLKFAGIVFHQYHNECSRANLEENDQLLRKTVEEKTISVPNGLSKYLE
ncbi:MAG: glycosyltransferase family 2 protein [Paludibacteraceae bacterium]|nr:glycosyltransferase family 2 protein [Paludibacteraceae bacterium]